MSAPPDLSPDLILFGGTFDPVHNAHLEIARAAANLTAAPKVLFIPAANPPHKNLGPLASYEDRVRMVELACEADPRFEVSRIEAGSARSFSIDTIEKLRPLGSLAFLIGADAFADIATWHRWLDVVAAVEFIVASRPGASYRIPPEARVRTIARTHFHESSSEVRRMIAEGVADIPVPAAVLAYIQANNIYRHCTPAAKAVEANPSQR